MGFLNGGVQLSGQGIPRPLQSVDPDLAFGAPLMPEATPNIIQELLNSSGPLSSPGGLVNPADVGAPTVVPPSNNGRGRRSVLDIIGGLSDVIADVGGAKPMYQPGLDAQTERQRAGVDYDWRQKFNTQKLTGGEQEILRGEQQIAAGENALEDSDISRMGQAVRGLSGIFSTHGAAGVQKAWPLVAAQLKISPEEQAAFSEQLAADPEGALQALNGALNDPVKSGSQPKEIQIYEMLKTRDPDKAEEYLAAVASGDKGITDYQEAQLGLGRDRLEQQAAIAAENRAVRREALRQRAMGKTPKPAAKGGSGGSDDVTNILNDFGITLSGPKDPVADLIAGSTSGQLENYASMIPGVLGKATPGKTNIGRLETIDNAIVLALAGGKLGAGVSNADRDFFKEMTGKISDANIPSNQRLAAWDQIKARLRGIQARSAAPAARPAGRPAPRTRAKPAGGAPKRLKYNPATGKIE